MMDGDYFRTARFGGFQKDDVMRYIEQQEQRIFEATEAQMELKKALRQARKELRQWMQTAKLQRRRSASAGEVQRALEAFQEQLQGALESLREIEAENTFLRRKITALEQEPSAEEPASVPLEQLTFSFFLQELEEQENL